jgi:hypothetical protein
MEGGCEFSHLHAPGGPLCATTGEEPGQGNARLRRPGGAGESGIFVQGVMQLRSGNHDQDPAKDRSLTPTSFYKWREDPKFPRYDLSPNSAVCECRCSRTWLPRARCNANADSASATRSVNADTRPGASLVVAPTPPVGFQPRGNSLSGVAAVATTQRLTGAV